MKAMDLFLEQSACTQKLELSETKPSSSRMLASAGGRQDSRISSVKGTRWDDAALPCPCCPGS